MSSDEDTPKPGGSGMNTEEPPTKKAKTGKSAAKKGENSAAGPASAAAPAIVPAPQPQVGGQPGEVPFDPPARQLRSGKGGKGVAGARGKGKDPPKKNPAPPEETVDLTEDVASDVSKGAETESERRFRILMATMMAQMSEDAKANAQRHTDILNSQAILLENLMSKKLEPPAVPTPVPVATTSSKRKRAEKVEDETPVEEALFHPLAETVGEGPTKRRDLSAGNWEI